MSHKGTYRVSLGGGINARKPGKRTNTILGPGTLVPNWASDDHIKEWLGSGHIRKVADVVSTDTQVENSAKKDLDTKPVPDAPGVTNVAGSEPKLDIDETKEGKADVKNVQPPAATEEIDPSTVQVDEADEEKVAAEQEAADAERDADLATANGKWMLTAEQLEGKEVEELNAMIVERMNDEEKEGFDGMETVEEAVAYLGQDL